MLRREIKISGQQRVVKHTWRAHPKGFHLTSTLLKKGTEAAVGKAVGSVVDDLDGVSLKALEHANGFRERATKRQRKQPERPATRSAAVTAVAAAAAARGPRLGSDARLARSDPLEAHLFSGLRRSTQPTTTPPRRRQTAPVSPGIFPLLSISTQILSPLISPLSRQTAPNVTVIDQHATDRHREGVKQNVLEDDVLKEELRELLCVEELGEGAATKAAVDAENIRTLVASIETLKLHSHTSIDRAAYNTVVAAAAGAEHTCDPDDPCTPAEPSTPAEPQGAVSLAARAQGLGVRDATFRAARIRMHKTDHTIPPKDALEKGRYLWAPRKERSDKMDERVMGLARRFWHSDDISRASGDSGTKAMWRPSKKAGEEYHPRRQLMVAGDQVWRKFLKWPEYLGLKAELLREDSSFTDPGRTVFLSTRCGCLVEPKVSQCACQIHTQQGLYLKAFEMLMPAIHANCECTCSWCDGSGCGKSMAMCKDLHSFSEALACEKVDFLAEDRGGRFEHWGRKPACVAMECPECGFGNPGGIPMNCDALGSMADRVVGWLRFEDQVMEDGEVHKKQQLPQAGKLGDLWDEFVEHSKKYMHHHELAKREALTNKMPGHAKNPPQRG